MNMLAFDLYCAPLPYLILTSNVRISNMAEEFGAITGQRQAVRWATCVTVAMIIAWPLSYLAMAARQASRLLDGK